MSLTHTRVLRAVNFIRAMGVKEMWAEHGDSIHPLAFYCYVFKTWPDPQFHRKTKSVKVKLK